jgi:predicted PolB exonuclease-like 3'-5' exonuclease
VFDTMLAWAGGRGRVGQDKLCRVLGIDAKGSELGDEIDGSKVWDYIKDGRIADVAKYCGGDVNRARDLHRRLTFTAA